MGNEGRLRRNQERRTSRAKGIFPPADHTHFDLVERLVAIESGERDITHVTTAYTALEENDVITCNGTFDLTLYTAFEGAGMTIVNIGTGEITLKGTINGSLDMVLDANSAIDLFGSTAPDWRIG